MAEKKIIVVVGATGSQGGGLVRAILEDPSGEFTVRALTRDVNSDKAKELARQGAEVVAADIDDLASLERAFKGAYGAYCVTFFWAHMSPERELREATHLAEAAKRANVKHVIWSTLEDTRKWYPLTDTRIPTVMEKYKVPHFDAKAEANEAFTRSGVPTTFLMASFYWDNFILFGMGPKPGADGKLAVTLPMGTKKLAGIAANDIGRVAYAIFKGGQQFFGKTIGIAGEQLTGEQIAGTFSQVLGRDVRYNAVEPEVYRSFGFPGAVEIGNMFQFYRDYDEYFQGARDVALTRRLNPKVQSLADWLAQNKPHISLE